MSFLRRHGLLFQLLLTALLLALLVWRIDVPMALWRVREAELRWVLLGLAVITTSRLVQAYRWRLFLGRREDVPLAPLAGVYLVSQLANTLVPLRGGDVLRVHIASRRFGIPHAELVATVFVVESVLDWVAGMAVFIAGLLVLDPPFISRPLVAAAAALIGGAFAVTVWLARVDHSRDLGARAPVRWLPRRVRPAAAEQGRRFLDGLEALRDTGHAALVAVVAVAIVLLEVLVYWCLGRAFGLELGFAQYIVLMVGANVVLAFPVTPWSIGSFELVVVEVAGLLGADRALAASYALGAHLVLMLWLNVMGLVSLWALGLELRDLVGTGREGDGARGRPRRRGGSRPGAGARRRR